MLGRATRAIEMSRGGREGNNAFLSYEAPSSRYDRDALDELIEDGTDYKELLRMSKLKHSCKSYLPIAKNDYSFSNASVGDTGGGGCSTRTL